MRSKKVGSLVSCIALALCSCKPLKANPTGLGILSYDDLTRKLSTEVIWTSGLAVYIQG